MKVVEFLKISREMLKIMSEYDLRTGDYRHLPMYEEYAKLRKEGVKKDAIHAILAERYEVSESTIKRVVRRFEQEFKS